jgi:hypothetical protein
LFRAAALLHRSTELRWKETRGRTEVCGSASAEKNACSFLDVLAKGLSVAARALKASVFTICDLFTSTRICTLPLKESVAPSVRTSSSVYANRRHGVLHGNTAEILQTNGHVLPRVLTPSTPVVCAGQCR